MRAGKMDRQIKIEAYVPTGEDEYGTPLMEWADFATVRAQMVQQSTDEFLASYGETQSFGVVFRTRWMEGVTTDHRVVYQGRNLNIRETRELGRREGLELRCEEVPQ